jgi:hypothetical protein
VNSRTGLALSPERILVNGQPAEPAAKEGGVVLLELPNGTHTLRAEADGFSPMELQVTVNGHGNPVTDIELDPIGNFAEPELDATESLLRGTVADADTAEPISGARITVADSHLRGQTTATGEFQFQIKTGAPTHAGNAAVTLEATAEGYQPLRLKNIRLAAGSSMRLPIRLDRETSATAAQDVVEQDHWVHPGSDFLSDWVFDVSIR